MKAIDWICANEDSLWDAAFDLWKHPELSEHEDRSSECLAELLQENGFHVEKGIAGLSTAFKAIWGDSGIRIGFLAEYDALPGLSQNLTDHAEPIEGQDYGHGCGHNLLGVAIAGAAISLKEFLLKTGKKACIQVFGCPSEEIMIGKIVMAKAGVFNDLDIALSWHPGEYNMASEASYQAMRSIKFHFHGMASHASMAPDKGKSALDAVELMNVGANYYREHVPFGGQLHYVITDGGEKPNIIPDKAGVWYFVRGAHDSDVSLMVDRLKNIAHGAALMTDTTFEAEEITGCHETLIVPELVKVIDAGMREHARDLTWTEEDVSFSKRMLKNGNRPVSDPVLDAGIKAPKGTPCFIMGSSDLSDVSWIVPTGMLFSACYPIGTPNHSWMVTVCSGNSIGRKGMIFASKALASVASRLISDPKLVDEIKRNFREELSRNT